jgi:hypothetical protein
MAHTHTQECSPFHTKPEFKRIVHNEGMKLRRDHWEIKKVMLV